MADPIGVSFSPAGGGPGQQQNGQRPTPVQQAIQTLSLRIPQHAGAGAFTPQPLLDSPGGSGFGNPDAANVLEMIKRLLFGNRPGQNGTGPSMPRDGGEGGQPGGTMPGPAPGGFDPGMSLTPRFNPIDTGWGAPAAPPEPPPAPSAPPSGQIQNTRDTNPGIQARPPAEGVPNSLGNGVFGMFNR